jgi:septal ring factor EnvC (AmiA/AmiB activator)
LDVRFKAQQSNLKRKEADNTKLMEQQTEKKISTEQKMKEASQKEIEIKESLAHIKVAKAAAEETLREALPVHEKGKAAVARINQGEDSKIKSVASPPEIIGEIEKLICALFNKGEEFWAKAGKYMTNQTFLSDMKDFSLRDKCTNEKKMQRVQNCLRTLEVRHRDVEHPGDSARMIFEWSRNIYAFYEVDKGVRPKELQVKKMENEQRKSQTDFLKIKKELQELHEEQARVAQKLQQSRAKQEELKRQKDQLEQRLNAMQHSL